MGGARVYTISDISEIQGCPLYDRQDQGGPKCSPSGVLQVGEARVAISTVKTNLPFIKFSSPFLQALHLMPS